MFTVTIERFADYKRFRKTIAASSKSSALRRAYRMLSADAAAYAVISIEAV